MILLVVPSANRSTSAPFTNNGCRGLVASQTLMVFRYRSKHWGLPRAKERTMSSQQKSATVVSHCKTINRTGMSALLLASILLAGTLCPAANRASSSPLVCNSGSLPTGGDGTQDVQVVGPGICTVGPGAYYYHNFNIYSGGTLEFMDSGNIDLWAANILVENNSALIAGSPSVPYGVNGILTIHLWGPAQATGTGKGDGGVGITCLSDQVNQCGVPTATWNSNPSMGLNPSSCVSSQLPGSVNDCFYAYMPLDYDDGGTPPGYFGYKVLGVSYGGTLQLFGKGRHLFDPDASQLDRKSTRLNSSHLGISYAVFCLKK